jgi:hypothetical protein
LYRVEALSSVARLDLCALSFLSFTVIKFYTHRCFQRYPHFQLDDQVNNKEEALSNKTLKREHIQEAQQANANLNHETEELENTSREQQSLPVRLEPGLPKTKESPPTSDSASVANTSAYTSAEDKGLITVPSLEREACDNQPSLMGGYLEDPLSLMKDPPPGFPILANESSSVEPTWGRLQRQSERELQQSLKAWEEVNINRTGDTYCTGRCHVCDITM